ncbi:MAG: hypothetical protein MRY21_03885 [Simkaniaceae bacterium]|nr:hypothetical protein [Simkaniaceae bacterium]
MRKVIYIVLGIFVVLVVALFIVYTQLARIVSSELTKRAGVEVSMSRIYLTPNRISVSDFFVGNPPKTILPQALKIRSIHVDAPLGEYTKDNIVIEEISLHDVYVGLDFPGSRYKNSNWERITDNLKRNNDSEPSKNGKETEVLIKKLVLYNVEVQIAMEGNQKKVRTLKPFKKIEFTNVTSSGGIPSSQIMNLVMKEALREFLSPDNLQKMLRDAVDPNSGGPFKSLFSEAS